MKTIINNTEYNLKRGSLKSLYCLYFALKEYEPVFEMYNDTIKKYIDINFAFFLFKGRIKNILNKYTTALKNVLKDFVKNNIKTGDIVDLIKVSVLYSMNKIDLENLKKNIKSYELKIKYLEGKNNNLEVIEKLNKAYTNIYLMAEKLYYFGDIENRKEYTEIMNRYRDKITQEKVTYEDKMNSINEIILQIMSLLKINRDDAENMNFLEYLKIVKNYNIQRANNVSDIAFAQSNKVNEHIKRLLNGGL